MICPGCGHEQAEAPECAHCGIVVAKWKPERPHAAASEPDQPRAQLAVPELAVKTISLFSVNVSVSLTTLWFLLLGTRDQGDGFLALSILPLAGAFVVWRGLGASIRDESSRRGVVWAGIGAIWVWLVLMIPELGLQFMLGMAMMGHTGADVPFFANLLIAGSVVLTAAGLATSWFCSRHVVRNGGPAPSVAVTFATPMLCLLVSIGVPMSVVEHRRRAAEEEVRTRPARRAAALDDMQARCDHGERQACYDLAQRFRGTSLGKPADAPRALALLERACALATTDEPQGPGTNGCASAAEMLREGSEVAADLARSAILFERGCDLGNHPACDGLGRALANGAGMPRDAARAAQMFRKACGVPDAAGFMPQSAPSCAILGRLHLEGDGVPRDVPQALALFELACFGQSGIGCFELGRLYHHGIGVPLDVKKGEAQFERACDLESNGGSSDRGGCKLVEKECESDAPRSCLAAAAAIRDDEARSAALLRRACDAGQAEGCYQAGRKYENGGTKWRVSTKPAPIDPRLAESLYARGCALDPKRPACAGASKLKLRPPP